MRAFLLPLLMLIPALCAAQSGLWGELDLMWEPGKPVDISADHMEFDPNGKGFELSGKVHVSQGAFSLKAGKMKIETDAEGGIRRLEATQSVQLTNGSWRARADRLVYQHPQRLLVLTGFPEVSRAHHRVRGKRIEFDLARDRVRVEAASTSLQLQQADGDAEAAKTADGQDGR